MLADFAGVQYWGPSPEQADAVQTSNPHCGLAFWGHSKHRLVTQGHVMPMSSHKYVSSFIFCKVSHDPSA